MPPELSRRSFALLVGGVGVGSATVGAGTYSAFSDQETASGTIQAARDFGFRLNCGGAEYVANDDGVFVPDDPYTQASTTGSTGDGIARTNDDELYRTERSGNGLSYDVSSLENGTYDVLFHFAEIDETADGARVFDVTVEGNSVIESLDIHDVVGHDTALLVGVQDVSLTDGTFSISSTSSAGVTKFSAIEIISSPHPELPYTQVDATPSGNAIIDQNNLVIHAAGTDVWINDDEYGAIVEEDVSGDAVAETSVTSQEVTEGNAQAGIMVRNDASAAASSIGYASIHRAPDDRVHLMWDSNDDGFVDTSQSAIVTQYPTELRLTKSGTTLTGEYSIDGGSNWQTVGTCTVASADTTQDWGLYATSHVQGTRGTAVFDRFETITDSTPPSAPTNLTSPGRDSSSVDLDWGPATDSGGAGLDHYSVYADGTVVQEVAAGSTSSTVGGLDSGTAFDFHVTAVDRVGNESNDSNTITVTTDSSTLCVEIQSDFGADASWSQTVSVQQNTEYTLGGWIRTENLNEGGGRGALFNVHELQQSSATTAVTGTQDWTYVEQTVNSGSNTELQINALFGGWGTATGTAWFDNVVFENPDGVNLLSNPDFEDGTADPWTEETYDGLPEFSHTQMPP